ncbi:MAG: hypothetical protein PVG14_19555 [Anaerolineales bacterium]
MRGISSDGKVTVYVDPEELITAPLYIKGPDDEIPRRSGDWLGNAITRFVWYQMHAKTQLGEGREFNAVKLEWSEERGQFEVIFMEEPQIANMTNLNVPAPS